MTPFVKVENRLVGSLSSYNYTVRQNMITGGAGYKTLHKIAVRSYKQPFGCKNLKKRGLITDHFWDRNLK